MIKSFERRGAGLATTLSSSSSRIIFHYHCSYRKFILTIKLSTGQVRCVLSQRPVPAVIHRETWRVLYKDIIVLHQDLWIIDARVCRNWFNSISNNNNYPPIIIILIPIFIGNYVISWVSLGIKFINFTLRGWSFERELKSEAEPSLLLS